ncbi:MAG: hypothetical protein ACR2IE_19800 [Candidatus Sumerlaeaceae bacterium]
MAFSFRHPGDWALLLVAGITAILSGQAVIAQPHVIHARIGTIEEDYHCTHIARGGFHQVDIDRNTTGPQVLRFVIPDDLEGHAFDIELCEGHVTTARRSGTTSGVGRRSIFLPPADHLTTTVAVINRANEPLYLEGIYRVPELGNEQQHTLPPDDFTMALLFPADTSTTRQRVRALDQLSSAPGVQFAAGFELYFARLSVEELRLQLRGIRQLCETHHVKALISPCSWWAGTPPEVYTRLDFQQVCWSPADNGPAADSLKELLGARWSSRYGLTTPNMWSNTPWQTMNHPELNAMRSTRLKQVVPIVEEELHGKLCGYVSENEPAYWAWDASDYMYPVKRPDIWADFNPHTVADAKRDGLELNPADGLTLKERMWLHENAARYIQANINDLNTCKPSAPVYSHALLEQHFPLQGTGHYRPYAEVARVQNARLGLELLRKANFDGLWRVREWGPWGCINREENDGVAMEYHLGMLQLMYALGAENFNSYNWQSVNENGRAMQYFNSFLDSVRKREVIVGERPNGTDWRPLHPGNEPGAELIAPLEVSYLFPWANELSLELRAADSCTSIAVWLTQGAGGPILAWRNIRSVDVATSGPTHIELGDLLKLEQDDPITLHVKVQETGWELRSSADGPSYRLICDLIRARRYNQWLVSTVVRKMAP